MHLVKATKTGTGHTEAVKQVTRMTSDKESERTRDCDIRIKMKTLKSKEFILASVLLLIDVTDGA